MAALNEFIKWYRTLDPASRKEVDVRVAYLSRMGIEATTPFVKLMVGTRYPMGELRYDSPPSVHIRVLFIFDADTKALLLVGGDKTGNWDTWYATNIRRAEQLYEAHRRFHPTTEN